MIKYSESSGWKFPFHIKFMEQPLAFQSMCIFNKLHPNIDVENVCPARLRIII